MEKAVFAVLMPSKEENFEPSIIALAKRHAKPMAIVLKNGQCQMRITSTILSSPMPMSPQSYKKVKSMKQISYTTLSEEGTIIGQTIIDVE